MTKEALNSKRNLLCFKGFSLKLRRRLVEHYLWSVLMYGYEVWAIEKREIERRTCI